MSRNLHETSAKFFELFADSFNDPRLSKWMFEAVEVAWFLIIEKLFLWMYELVVDGRHLLISPSYNGKMNIDLTDISEILLKTSPNYNTFL